MCCNKCYQVIMMAEKTEERWIRGPKLEILTPTHRVMRYDRGTPFYTGIPFDEALRIAEQGRRVIASNARMSKALVKNDEWRRISKRCECWTGTMTAYVKPGERFGAMIEYIDRMTQQRWVFPVPEQFRGIRDAILVTEHPDYTLERDGKNFVVLAKTVDIVENFPAVAEHHIYWDVFGDNYSNLEINIRIGNGWSAVDAKHSIPQARDDQGKEIHLNMTRYESWVGPVSRSNRSFFCGGNDGLDISLTNSPSAYLEVPIEALEESVPSQFGGR